MSSAVPRYHHSPPATDQTADKHPCCDAAARTGHRSTLKITRWIQSERPVRVTELQRSTGLDTDTVWIFSTVCWSAAAWCGIDATSAILRRYKLIDKLLAASRAEHSRAGSRSAHTPDIRNGSSPICYINNSRVWVVTSHSRSEIDSQQ